MIELFRYSKSNLYKLKHSCFFWFHMMIPIIGAGIMFLYAARTPVTDINKMFGFFQIVAMIYPFAVSIVCGIIAEQEENAGHYQNILTIPNRKIYMMSMLLIFVFFGLISVVGASVIFYVMFPVTGTILPLSFGTFIVPSFVLWGCSISGYALSLMLALRFGRNVCIGAGAIGVLLTALLQTGLGTGIWYVLPYGISIHLAGYSLERLLHFTQGTDKEIKIAIISCIIYTIVFVGTLIIWFAHYSGRQPTD